MKKRSKKNKKEVNKRQTEQKSILIKNKNSAHGITLIALVITIIVLLILAAVSIATLTGENGILTQASTARDKTKEGELEERAKLILTNWNFEKGKGKTFEEYLNEHFDTVVNNGDGTYTVTLEDYEMTVDEDGNVIIKGQGQEEEKIEPTDIYVTLYTDGTLGFSNDETTIEGKTVQESYGNIRGKKFTFSTCPWKNNTSITTVNIVNKIAPTDTGYWFFRLTNLTNIENMSNLKTNNVTNMKGMFNGCTGLTSLDIKSFNTSNVTNMDSMFSGCNSLKNLDLKTLDTSAVTIMGYMFSNCRGLNNLNVSNFNTNNVTDMQCMFENCSSLENLDITNFDTSKVTTMNMMFAKCSGLANLDVTHFNTSKVTNMSAVFSGCSNLTSIDVTNFDTSNVTGISQMFEGCSNLTSLDLSSFNTSKVFTIARMFYGCSNLDKIYVSKEKWVMDGVVGNQKENVFTNCKTDCFTAEDGSEIRI